MEIWKEILETNGKYSVSSNGFIKRNKSISIKNRITKEKILKPYFAGKGYLSITLRINGKDCYRYVHRLVAKEFIENPKNLQEVNHKDRSKINNNLENLEWVDRRQNNHHWMRQVAPGVRKEKTGKWSSRIMINGVRSFLGCFNTENEAKLAYEKRLSFVQL